MQNTVEGELPVRGGLSKDFIAEGAHSKMDDKFMAMVSDMQDEID